MDYIFYIIIAIVISVLLVFLRPIKNQTIKVKNVGNITSSIGWCLVVFGLILGFSITIFYNRYIEIRNFIITSVANLKILYRIFKDLPDSEEVIESIKEYSNSVIEDLLPSIRKKEYNEKTKELHKKMDEIIIKYVADHPGTPFQNNILLRINTDDYFRQLVDEIKIGDYYISIIMFLFIIIVFLLWIAEVENVIAQLIIDFSVITILLSCIYLLNILNNVFVESPVSIDFSSFKDLVEEINSGDLKVYQ